MSTDRLVVNVKMDDYDVYVGRAVPRRGLPGSILANPFRIGQHGTREQVIEKYRSRLLARPDLLALIPGLRGKVLGCWCTPQEGFSGRLLCHAQILASLANDIPAEMVE